MDAQTIGLLLKSAQRRAKANGISLGQFTIEQHPDDDTRFSVVEHKKIEHGNIVASCASHAMYKAIKSVLDREGAA